MECWFIFILVGSINAQNARFFDDWMGQADRQFSLTEHDGTPVADGQSRNSNSNSPDQQDPSGLSQLDAALASNWQQLDHFQAQKSRTFQKVDAQVQDLQPVPTEAPRRTRKHTEPKPKKHRRPTTTTTPVTEEETEEPEEVTVALPRATFKWLKLTKPTVPAVTNATTTLEPVKQKSSATLPAFIFRVKSSTEESTVEDPERFPRAWSLPENDTETDETTTASHQTTKRPEHHRRTTLHSTAQQLSTTTTDSLLVSAADSDDQTDQATEGTTVPSGTTRNSTRHRRVAPFKKASWTNLEAAQLAEKERIRTQKDQEARLNDHLESVKASMGDKILAMAKRSMRLGAPDSQVILSNTDELLEQQNFTTTAAPKAAVVTKEFSALPALMFAVVQSTTKNFVPVTGHTNTTDEDSTGNSTEAVVKATTIAGKTDNLTSSAVTHSSIHRWKANKAFHEPTTESSASTDGQSKITKKKATIVDQSLAKHDMDHHTSTIAPHGKNTTSLRTAKSVDDEAPDADQKADVSKEIEAIAEITDENSEMSSTATETPETTTTTIRPSRSRKPHRVSNVSNKLPGLRNLQVEEKSSTLPQSSTTVETDTTTDSTVESSESSTGASTRRKHKRKTSTQKITVETTETTPTGTSDVSVGDAAVTDEPVTATASQEDLTSTGMDAEVTTTQENLPVVDELDATAAGDLTTRVTRSVRRRRRTTAEQ